MKHRRPKSNSSRKDFKLHTLLNKLTSPQNDKILTLTFKGVYDVSKEPIKNEETFVNVEITVVKVCYLIFVTLFEDKW